MPYPANVEELRSSASFFDALAGLLFSAGCCLAVVLRQRARRRFMIPPSCKASASPDGCLAITEDVCLSCLPCSGPCSIAQVLLCEFDLVCLSCLPCSGPPRFCCVSFDLVRKYLLLFVTVLVLLARLRGIRTPLVASATHSPTLGPFLRPLKLRFCRRCIPSPRALLPSLWHTRQAQATRCHPRPLPTPPLTLLLDPRPTPHPTLRGTCPTSTPPSLLRPRPRPRRTSRRRLLGRRYTKVLTEAACRSPVLLHEPFPAWS